MDYPSDYFAANRKLLKLGGLWITNKNKHPNTWLFFTIYNILCILCDQIIYFASEIVMLSETKRNWADLIEQVGMILQHLLANLKVFVIIWYRREIKELATIIKDDKFKYERSITFRPGTYFYFIKRLTSTFCVMFFCLANTVPTSMYIKAIIHFMKQSNSDFEKHNVTCSDLLPYYSWVPFKTDTKALCGLAMMGQSIPMFVYAWQIAAADTLYVTYIMYTKAHIQSLCGAFKSLRERCISRLNLNETSEVALNRKLHKEMNIEMRKCTQHLQTIIKICDMIENVFSYVALVQVLVSLFILITCLFTVSTVAIFSGQFVAQLVYLIAILIQLSTYCFFGNEITVTSSRLINAIYNSDWLLTNNKFKRSMIINMIRMQKPLIITVGKFTPLTLVTLTSIVRISYSYFAVLKNAIKNKN